MTKNLLDLMIRNGIGIDPLFFERSADAGNFPPHNIVQLSDDEYQLTLAVAGYSEAEIDIVIQNDILTIEGRRNPDRPSGGKMLYSGIAFRDFSRQFKIGEYVNVENADLKDGLLVIDLVRRIPEEDKPRRIEIGRHVGKLPPAATTVYGSRKPI